MIGRTIFFPKAHMKVGWRWSQCVEVGGGIVVGILRLYLYEDQIGLLLTHLRVSVVLLC